MLAILFFNITCNCMRFIKTILLFFVDCMCSNSFEWFACLIFISEKDAL